jgi:hypothetical protein
LRLIVALRRDHDETAVLKIFGDADRILPLGLMNVRESGKDDHTEGTR